VPGLPVLALPLTPKVASDQLLLAGGLTNGQPLAFAALRYRVPAGRTATTLTLTATGAGSQPIEACPLTGSFSAAAGGPLAHAPAYDCTTHVTVSPHEQSYRVAVGSLMRHQVLGVALLPTGLLEKVVLARPKVGALRLAALAKPVGPVTQSAQRPSPASITSATPAPPSQQPTTVEPVTPPDPATFVSGNADAAPQLAPTPTESLVPNALAADTVGSPSHVAAWLAAALAMLAFGLWRWVGLRAETASRVESPSPPTPADGVSR
jgi:hypothetical protein